MLACNLLQRREFRTPGPRRSFRSGRPAARNENLILRQFSFYCRTFRSSRFCNDARSTTLGTTGQQRVNDVSGNAENLAGAFDDRRNDAANGCPCSCLRSLRTPETIALSYRRSGPKSCTNGGALTNAPEKARSSRDLHRANHRGRQHRSGNSCPIETGLFPHAAPFYFLKLLQVFSNALESKCLSAKDRKSTRLNSSHSQ